MSTVLISGVFDPLHAGHVAYIQRAQFCRPEVVCVVSDDPAKHPPLVPLADRQKVLAQMGCTVLTGRSVASAIRMVRPRVFLKGREWEGRLPQDIVDACAAVDCTIQYCDTRLNSSSALLADYERARNAEKLAALETFVQSQTPAEKPWAPVTDYSWETREPLEAPQAEVIASLQPASVLDVGCGPGHLVRALKARGVNTIGADVRPHDDVVYFDVSATDYLGLPADRKHDVVICREVLEHLPVVHVARAVGRLVRLSKGLVYVTTRFTAKSHLLDVDGKDDLDPTHITMLNQDLLRTLFVLEGCTRRADLEQALDWMKKGRVLVYEVPRG